MASEAVLSLSMYRSTLFDGVHVVLKYIFLLRGFFKWLVLMSTVVAQSRFASEVVCDKVSSERLRVKVLNFAVFKNSRNVLKWPNIEIRSRSRFAHSGRKYYVLALETHMHYRLTWQYVCRDKNRKFNKT